MTPQQRHLRAQIAANARWGRPEARQAVADPLTRWERKVDPDGRLAPDVRRKCAESAMREHMARMRKARADAAAVRT
jgi:hypothetical protein